MKHLLFNLLMASFIFLQKSPLYASDGFCLECETPALEDINSCTGPEYPNNFYVDNWGPGSKYDFDNDLYYGFALKDVSPAPFRSDYSIEDEGSNINPLNITDCFLFPLEETIQLPNGCLSHGAERFWNYPGMAKINYSSGPNFWVMSLNNEDLGGKDETWEDPIKDSFHACNSGPPNLSFRPNIGSTVVSGDGRSFNLGLDMKAFHTTDKQVACGDASAPFLAFGAHCKRGNPHPVAYINTDKSKNVPSVLQFRSEVAKFARENIAIVYRLMIIAEWKGTDMNGDNRMMDRMIFVDLSNPAGRPDRENPISAHLSHKDWNWPAVNSFYYPGADLAFFDAAKMLNLKSCSTGLQQMTDLTESDEKRSYQINLTDLFQCANDQGLFKDKMPSGETIAVKGVHWVVEGVGSEGKLEVQVQNMDILKEDEIIEITTGLESDCSDEKIDFISNGSAVDINFCVKTPLVEKDNTFIWASGGDQTCDASIPYISFSDDWSYEDGQWRAQFEISSLYVKKVTVCVTNIITGDIYSHKINLQEEDLRIYADSIEKTSLGTFDLQKKQKKKYIDLSIKGLPQEKDRHRALGYIHYGKTSCENIPLSRFSPLGKNWSPIDKDGVSKGRWMLETYWHDQSTLCLYNDLTRKRASFSYPLDLSLE